MPSAAQMALTSPAQSATTRPGCWGRPPVTRPVIADRPLDVRRGVACHEHAGKRQLRTVKTRRSDEVASRYRCKSAGVGSASWVRLRGGSDSLGLIFGLCCSDGAWPQLAGWVEQGPAQVLQQPQPVGGHGEPAPAAGGPVEDGPDQGEAAGFAGEPADDLDPAAGLAEGALDMKLECRTRLWCSAGKRR
jgi:hypothetical protein